MQNDRFVNRLSEIDSLNQLIGRRNPGPGQLVLIYGRRRIGKSALLAQWGMKSGRRYIHWSVQQAPADLQRQALFGRLLNVPTENAPTFHTWESFWEAAREELLRVPTILVIDEIPYAIKVDPSLESSLQHAWDRYFKASDLILALCGSQVQVMETIGKGRSPLGGRMTAVLQLDELPFSSLAEFFPSWSHEELVATYAIVGGIPAYLELFDPTRTLEQNIHEVILNPLSVLLAEPEFLLIDEVRDPGPHLAVLQAIGKGLHEFKQISGYSHIDRTALPRILATLQDIRLVERVLPATIPPSRQKSSRRSRYFLQDNFLKFYFQFIAPYQDRHFNPDLTMAHLRSDLRSFVGATAFEELCRSWVRHQSAFTQLAIRPDTIGSHWSKVAQADVVGVNWATRQVLIAECKWGGSRVSKADLRPFFETRIPDVLTALPKGGRDWQVVPVAFTRAGLSEAATRLLEEHQAIHVGLKNLILGLP
jgi:hypothetical protein